MRYLLAVLTCVGLTVPALATDPTFVLSNGIVTEQAAVPVSTPPAGPTPVGVGSTPVSGACYVDAFGRTVCPRAVQPAAYTAPTAYYYSTGVNLPAACPCGANCPCAIGGLNCGAGNCPANLPMPMTTNAPPTIMLGSQGIVGAGPVRSFFAHKPLRSFFGRLFGRSGCGY